MVSSSTAAVGGRCPEGRRATCRPRQEQTETHAEVQYQKGPNLSDGEEALERRRRPLFSRQQLHVGSYTPATDALTLRTTLVRNHK